MISKEKIEHFCGCMQSRMRFSFLNLRTSIENNELWLTFFSENESHLVTVPLPFYRNSIELITVNGIERAISNYFSEADQRELDYLEVMYRIICGDPTGIIPEFLVKKVPHIKQVEFSFKSGNAATTVYNLQRAINEVINRMPLHESDMKSMTINNRLIIIDDAFDSLVDPQDKLSYQVEKNMRHFCKGWTSLGLSDGVLADKNYILKEGLRKYTPFGLRHDNPGRNLYSAQDTKGDEYPRVRSESMQKLHDSGIRRTGWNWFTLYADIPDVFEDQIMVDKSHAWKSISHTRRHVCFGEILVEEGQIIKHRQPLSVTKDGEFERYTTIADKSIVDEIEETEVNVNNKPEKAHNVVVRYVRRLKDGTKITNLHGNKGVIRLKHLGHAIDPKTGKKKKIDVIVSGKSIKKRKNFGQILEALFNTIHGDKKVRVIRDKAETSVKSVENALETAGYPKSGTFMCKTYAGEVEGICGDVFWGVSKEPEDQIWTGKDTLRENGRGLRTAGIKLSNVEFRAITTRFGKDSAVLDEVMSYSQGAEDLHEQFSILKSKVGKIPNFKPTIDVSAIKPLVQDNGTLFPKHKIEGTALDESLCPNGFAMQVPLVYQVQIDEDGSVVHEGYPLAETINEATKIVNFDRIYVPSSELRRCWKHSSGEYGLSDLGICINNIVKLSHMYLADTENDLSIRLLYISLNNYFKRVANRIGTKNGELSTYGMAVRYPSSAKAVATLSNSLPKNTIEIHRSMAKTLNVSNGDVVLVERFPCLGFISIRPQKVKITSDPLCKYTIRASGNSLGSLSLDFDGDVLFIASFHSKGAKRELLSEWTNPNKSCYDAIKTLNKKAGVPHTKNLELMDYELCKFDDLTNEEHAELVRRATGVKSHTGPVIALAYNIMRILENSDVKNNQKTNVAIELFLDKVGNSVFKQKHGVKSLHDVVIDAICTADVNTLVEHGFRRGTSTIICNVIKQKAKEIGITNLVSYHRKAKEKGWSKVINLIVRKQNKIYFASRSQLEGCKLLEYMKSPAVDLPSKMVKWTLSGKFNKKETEIDRIVDEKFGVRSIMDKDIRSACNVLCNRVTEMLMAAKKKDKINRIKAHFSHLTNVI